VISISKRASKTRPSFAKTRKELEALSNRDLLDNLEKLIHKERRLKVLVLLYLSEIDKRQLYLPMGCSSLFDFCTLHLKYTRATAARRIRAARVAAKYPEALEMLRSGEINITTLSMIGDILDKNNRTELLESIKNKSTRHVEMLVSRHRPVPVIRDTVRPVCVRRRVESGACSSAGTGGQNLPPTEDTGSRKCNKLSSSAETNSGRSGAAPSAETIPCRPGDAPCAETNPAPNARVILEQRLKLGFSVSPEFMSKFNKIKSLLSNTHPEGIDFETLFEHLMDDYLERYDPENRRKRRADRVEKSERRKSKPVGARRSRHIPPDIRNRVYARDKGRCSFVGANGKRCNSTWDLEIDHVLPFARGGNNSPGNLRLLCRKHNMYEAEKQYGRKFMQRRTTR